MTQKLYTLPLSRWHHVADRIRIVGETKQKSAYNALNGTVLNHKISAEQEKALFERGQKALHDFSIARLAYQTVALIREKVAQSNAEFGVNALLSQAEGKRKEALALRSLLSIDLLTKVPLSDVNKVFSETTEDKDTYGYTNVNPNLVDLSSFNDFDVQASQLESEVANLTDVVADINRNKLGIELPEELAKLAGL